MVKTLDMHTFSYKLKQNYIPHHNNDVLQIHLIYALHRSAS
jgi:hypothetical protein